MYAGTLPLEALKVIIFIAASHSPEFSLMHVDVSRACFHAKLQRLVLVKMQVEDCLGKSKGKIELLKKSTVRYQRCSKQLGTRPSDTVKRFCGDRNEGESVGAQEAAGERVPNQSEHHRGRFSKEYQDAESESTWERDRHTVSS